jgi:hypothetical protein
LRFAVAEIWALGSYHSIGHPSCHSIGHPEGGPATASTRLVVPLNRPTPVSSAQAVHRGFPSAAAMLPSLLRAAWRSIEGATDLAGVCKYNDFSEMFIPFHS